MHLHAPIYPSIFAIDVGFGNTKAVWGQEGESKWSELIFRSVCPPSVSGLNVEGLAEADRITVEPHGNHYLVGPHADRVRGGIQALYPEYIKTHQYEALMRGAWHYMMKDVGYVVGEIDMLVLGLPVSEYNAKREILREIGLRPRRVPLPAGMRTPTGNAGGRWRIAVLRVAAHQRVQGAVD